MLECVNKRAADTQTFGVVVTLGQPLKFGDRGNQTEQDSNITDDSIAPAKVTTVRNFRSSSNTRMYPVFVMLLLC